MHSLSVPESIAKESYEDSKFSGGLYTLENHIKTIQEKYSVDFDGEALLDWFKSLDFKSYLFENSEDVLRTLQKENKLILLTKGAEDYQKMKVDGSGINKYFHEVHIVPTDKELFLKDKNFEGPIYFINDKINENEKIRTLFPDLKVIHAHNDFNIKNLLEDFLSIFE
jgi:hypothetical protein